MSQGWLNPGHSLKNISQPLHSMSDVSTPSRWRRNRSSANLLEQVAQPAPAPAPATAKPPASKPAPKLERTPSRMSLFNLFSRPKVEKARGHSEVGLAMPMQPQQPPKPAPTPAPVPKSSLRVNPAPSAQQAQRSRASIMLKPMSMKSSSVKRQPVNWDPPPLFQAYPQAIKYATVQACIFSPDVLLRTQSQRRQHNLLRERMDSHRDLSATLEREGEAKKLEKHHKRLISNSVLHPPTPELTNKIYVLVTSGFVLQYSGDGPFDRLPEKALQLGKESAAFACDLIPGKHWVLQISQSANEDGTVSVAPKNSLLSRFRLQNASARRTATSFLLVLESAEEMDSWLTAVRKEIDSLGGRKAREEPEAKSSSEEAAEKPLRESPNHRYLVQRDPNRISKMAPVDSPLQSQYDSPRIVASDWEGDRSEKTVSISDSASLHSSKYGSKRKSVEASSIATSAVSHEQLQLDQLRERSRFSYMSTATSVSGTMTRNTSCTSSPAPNSPHQEAFSPAETEPLRSATSLRSFHMNPNNATTNRRRSMQLLPTTNEDNTMSASPHSTTPQRHSIYGSTSPTLGNPEQEANVPVTPLFSRPTSVRFSHSPILVRSSTRSSSAPPPRNGTISPPPRDPAPPPGRPQSTIGSLPSAATLTAYSANRASMTSKPFLRPLPVRTQNADGSVVIPRRYSSLSPAPAPIPLGIVVNRSVTAPVKLAVASISAQQSETKTTLPAQSLRRPTSMQIRSDPAPFLSSSRPVAVPARAIASTPSFVPGKRASTTHNLHQSPSIPVLRQQAQLAQRGVTPRRSMPVMGLPPPAPPPNMPLPPPPPISARPVAV
ncbi:hypothetical protein K469DRAFT_730149 [Zopfia rhizophila CBS 207.26]|uniref:PH domain-containing protein n=1 Tax=Zopfia rhizophila CBS 207.26 TaxID=1314779 RepID=A0A6A6EQ15_9PEZI|nr:hypothetical protein K469DRAFT_730149 [Zopfia rhizophila CBS 207.26]